MRSGIRNKEQEEQRHGRIKWCRKRVATRNKEGMRKKMKRRRRGKVV